MQSGNSQKIESVTRRRLREVRQGRNKNGERWRQVDMILISRRNSELSSSRWGRSTTKIVSRTANRYSIKTLHLPSLCCHPFLCIVLPIRLSPSRILAMRFEPLTGLLQSPQWLQSQLPFAAYTISSTFDWDNVNHEFTIKWPVQPVD